jgi:hypothetical protein
LERAAIGADCSQQTTDRAPLTQAEQDSPRVRAAVPSAWSGFPASDRFVIRRWLGAGGMGTVFEALDLHRKEQVALKTMSRGDPAGLYYFKREFRSLADVHHPNLVKLHELFSVEDQWFFTMELIDGVDLLRHLGEASARDAATESADARHAERVRDVFQQLACGLVALHDAGKLHRDIKPSNVLVTTAGRVVLLDFGLTKEFHRTAQESNTEVRIVGTMAYMSPEQAAGRTLSPASDWFSFGVMLYQALTGRMPQFLNTDLEPVAPQDPKSIAILGLQQYRTTSGSAETPDVSTALCDLCMELLALRADERPSGRDVVGRLGTTPRNLPEGDSTSVGVGQPVVFVGRTKELEVLNEVYGKMRSGNAALVEIHGRSGIGKSALVQRFLEETRTRERAVVLTGRCYEREFVPHKALDSLIDELSHFLRRRSRLEVEALLPRDVASLVKLFPVLRRVDAIVAAPGATPEIPDPQEVRRRAVASLRELLARIADRWPLILWIDDLQWGDTDSAVLLGELLRSPQSPVLLLLASYRREDLRTSPCLLGLREVLVNAGSELVRRDVAVDALEPDDAGRLARMLLGDKSPGAGAAAALDRAARSIALESGGNPFFVGELVRHQQSAAAAGKSDDLPSVDLEAVLIGRIRALPDLARRLLEVIAVAGRPVGASEACSAAGLDEHVASIDLLKQARLIRGLPSVLRVEVEVWHDRIREAVIREIAPDLLPQHHYRLAVALEESNRGDLEHLAMHFKEARESARACEYYALAAERAAQALAFDRAAQFYRQAIDLASDEHPHRRLWQTRLGDALANAGRGAEAARVYLQAADRAPPAQSRDLTRRAGFQYCITGHLDEGRAAFRRVLSEIGMSLPRSRWGTLLQLLWYRARLRLRGLGFQRRRPADISEEERLILDITESVAMGCSTNSPWQGALFQTRHLLQALDSGDPVRVALGISWEAGYASMEGGRHWSRTVHLLRQSQALADETQDPHAAGSSALAFGISEFLSGRYANSLQHNLRAEQILRSRCTGVTWEQDTAQVFGLWALFYMGKIADLRIRYQTVFQEARERGDRYLMTTLGSQVGTLLFLADDDPAGARTALEDLMSRWTNDGFTVQHHNAFFARQMIDLYEGCLDAAIRRLQQTEFQYRRSLLAGLQHVRIDLAQLKGRLFLAAAYRNPEAQSNWLRKARCSVRDLYRERMPYASALAKYLEANLAIADRCAPSGRHAAENSDLLRQAAEQLAQADLLLLSHAANWQCGRLLPGDSGGALIEQASEWVAAQGIVNPPRLLRAVSFTFLGVESDELAAGQKDPKRDSGGEVN